MDKPNALIQVLDDLRSEGIDTSVVTIKGSRAQVFLAAGSDPITLSREECEMLLHSPETVDMLADALGYPPDGAIELHHITIDDEVLDALERNFSAVDEV